MEDVYKKRKFEREAEEFIKEHFSTPEKWKEFEKLLRYFENSERQVSEKNLEENWGKNLETFSEEETPKIQPLWLIPDPNYSFIRRYIALMPKIINTCEPLTSLKNIKLNCKYFYKTFMFEYCYNNYPEVSPENIDIKKALDVYIQTLKGTKTKKSYKSKNRAYGIALAIAYLNKKISYDIWNSKSELQKIARKCLKIDNNGDRAARDAKKIYLSGCSPKQEEMDRVQKNHPSDYEFGMKLYKESWP
jgi:hypothetical protein